MHSLLIGLAQFGLGVVIGGIGCAIAIGFCKLMGWE